MFSCDKYLKNIVGAGLCACQLISDFLREGIETLPYKVYLIHTAKH